ncbi:tRNA 2-selenouridine(34) synthase MnmH [Sporosarcina trichiuri]|uniref:tRNA 2-selenouridine(34) synthase MnmH n=1 Tax=Sporosarcina trichiuri TaxID=3056445 RepID=UPI0025B45913|nr:tRNA 2-selenouridine(34) synthase MnmH [Sporosarcina sp. 0.2-SM1T-5]WJY28214.1 tRNA 2-selenouridine(34) synthase MnmH [Sporosarcina sp. 0.2-SM1T-5]
MFRDISLKDLMELHASGAHTLIDVRSPKEYAESSIPGSLNIPVFNDEERAEVGTIYKQVGQAEAKKRGLEIFSAKLPQFIADFQAIGTPMTVFCWRGGMRSKTAATVLDLMGVHANRLIGGIRTYRQWVVEQLDLMDYRPELLVLNGYTGSGKTVILHKLADAGEAVVDLEGLAGHRGSIFGQIGLQAKNQKNFESLLLHELKRTAEEPLVFIEGESKRIGKVTMPTFLFEKKELSRHLIIRLPIEERVRLTLADYKPWEQPDEFLIAFEQIKRRIHVPVAKEIGTALHGGDYETATLLLLEHYYDPRYRHSTGKVDDDLKTIIEADTVEDAFEQVLAWKKEYMKRI